MIKVSIKEVQKKMIKEGIELSCPFCNDEGTWSLSEDIFELRQFDKGKSVNGNGGIQIIPLLVMTHSCGYTFLLNALRLGLIDNDEY